MFLLFNSVILASLFHALFVTRFWTRMCVSWLSLVLYLCRGLLNFFATRFFFKTTMKHIFQRGMLQIHPQPHTAQQRQIGTQSTMCHLPCVKVYSLTINVEVEPQKAPDIRVVEVLAIAGPVAGSQTGPPFSVKWCKADMKYPLFAA